MSEFREDSNIFDANGNGIQIQGHLKADAPDEEREDALIGELAALIEDTTPDNFDEERLDAILGELNVVAPLDFQVDAEKSLEHFYTKNADILALSKAEEKSTQKERENSAKTCLATEEKSASVTHIRRKYSRVSMLAAVLAALIAMTGIAQAAGFNIFEAIARWSEDIFYFERPSVDKQAVPYARYDSLYGLVVSDNTDVRVAPTWLPEDMKEQEISAVKTQDGMEYYAIYCSLSDSLSISILIT